MKESTLANNLKPYIIPWIQAAMNSLSAGSSGAGGTGALSVHALSGAYHTGAMADSQAPQFLMRNGSRSLIGNLSVDAGVTIDGVDLSAHAANPEAHQALVTVGYGLTLAGQLVGMHLATPSGLAVDATGLYIMLPTNSGLVRDINGLYMGAPTTLTVATTNDVVLGSHKHAITSTFNPGLTQSLLSTANDGYGTLQLHVLASDGTFFSGFAGSGYRIDVGVTEAGKASAEFDNLTIRGRMRVYELLIQQIRATNGSVFVTSSSIAEQISEADTAWEVNGVQLDFNGVPANFATTIYTIDTRKAGDDDDTDHHAYHGFLTGDAIRAQQVNWNGSTYDFVRQVDLTVTGVTSLFEYTAVFSGGNAPAVGDEFVRLGSEDVTRRGSVYLTSDDSNAPFIDIVDGIRTHSDWNTPGKIRVRLGKLTGITDATFGGTLSGYGLYGDNVYLKGKIQIAPGSTGMGNFADIPTPLTPPGGSGLFLSGDHMGYFDNGSWKTYIDSFGNMQLGDPANGIGLAWTQASGTLLLRNAALSMWDSVYRTVSIGSTGNVFLGKNISQVPTQSFYHEAATGDLYIGSRGGANIFWDASEGILKFRSIDTVQSYIDTEGSIVAGEGAVTLDSNGLKLEYDASWPMLLRKTIAWSDDPTNPTVTPAVIGMYKIGGSSVLRLEVEDTSSAGIILKGKVDAVESSITVGHLGAYVSSTLGFDNNKAIEMKDSGGTYRSVLYMNTGDDLIIGSGVASGNYVGFTVPTILDGADAITSNPPTAGSYKGWKASFNTTNYALGIAGYTMAAKVGVNGWFAAFAGNPVDDGSATAMDTGAFFGVNNTYMVYNGALGGAWTQPSLGTGWILHSATYHPPCFKKLGDLVMFRGVAKRTTATSGDGVGLFTLPAGYFNTTKTLIIAVSAAGAAGVNNTSYLSIIPSTGVVLFNGDGQTMVRLDGVQFSVS